jgi:hypothetical protein
LDENAIFEIEGDPRKVQHSLCLKAKKMKEPYHTTRFEEHLGKCSGPSKAIQKKAPSTGSQMLTEMSILHDWRMTPTVTKPAVKPIVNLPCPGLTPNTVPYNHCEKLETYFAHSPIPGGGGPTSDQVTATLFPGMEYKHLTERQKNSVRSAQRQQHLWRNHADIETVFSASCKKEVQAREGTEPSPCIECRDILEHKRFKQAISLPLPDKKNRKFMPKKLLDETAIEHYARATGLKTILGMHAEVSQIRFWLLGFGYDCCMLESTSAMSPLCSRCHRWRVQG